MRKRTRSIVSVIAVVITVIMLFGVIGCGVTADNRFTVSVISGTGGGVFENGESVTVTAVIPSGKEFKNWTSGSDAVSTDNPYTFSVSGDVTLTANFTDSDTVEYTVTVVNGTGGGKYEEGRWVTVQTEVPAGKVFKNWTSSDGVASKANPYSFRAGKDITLTPNFDNPPPVIYTVTVVNGEGGGPYAAGSQATITSSPPEGKRFKSWTSGITVMSEDDPYVFTVSGNIKLTANFVDIEVTDYTHDLVVYGDTAAAVSAAIAASREEVKVALVAPSVHLGGMLSGGLSATDLGASDAIIGGISREFFKRNGEKKGKAAGVVDWYAEPGVAEDILNEMLDETQDTDYGVDIFLKERLVEETGVVMSGNTITQIICESGKTFKAKQFIDASYEGDLMAQTGVTYTYGRESRDTYDESLAGVVASTIQGANNHQLSFNIKGRDENGNMKYEGVSEEPLAAPGTGDKKIQAYNFRMCLTINENNKASIPCPDGYDASRYQLLLDYINAWYNAKGSYPTDGDLLIIIQIGNTGKYDINNNNGFSTDYIGGNYNYPDGTYAERDLIWQDHYNYTAGLFYFLSTDPRVPEFTRNYISRWGLPLDEYEDTDNWTSQLYVREGRRMIGEYVMSQRDIAKGSRYVTKTDSIGMGSYRSDSHNVQRYINNEGYVKNEGNMEVEVEDYEIPYRMILPNEDEADNLLVSCTFSASHVSYSSIRMEPQYMIIGQAAGTAASIAIKDRLGVHDIDVDKLQSTLEEDNSVLHYGNHAAPENEYDFDSDVIAYDSFDNYKAGWGISQTRADATVITQNDSSVTIKKTSTDAYGFMTSSSFSPASGDFTYSFRAKLNSNNSVAEVSVRSGLYTIKTVLTRSDGTSGAVRNRYVSPSKTAAVDTSVWHDYQVVVNGDNYSYGVYVDGVLAWDGAVALSGGGNLIKIGADIGNAADPGGVADFDLDSFKMEKGGRKDGVRFIGCLFEDANANKITNIKNAATGNMKCSIVIENATDEARDIKLVAELFRSDEAEGSPVILNVSADARGISKYVITVNIPSDKTGLTIKITAFTGENFEISVLAGGIILGSSVTLPQ